MKVVINDCRGQFDLSESAIAQYAKRKGISLFLVRDFETILHKKYKKNFYYTKPKEKRIDANDGLWKVQDIKRNDAILIDLVTELGTKCNSIVSRLKVVEVEDNKKWKIRADDGKEFLEEVVA